MVILWEIVGVAKNSIRPKNAGRMPATGLISCVVFSLLSFALLQPPLFPLRPTSSGRCFHMPCDSLSLQMFCSMFLRTCQPGWEMRQMPVGRQSCRALLEPRYLRWSLSVMHCIYCLASSNGSYWHYIWFYEALCFTSFPHYRRDECLS